MGEKMQEGSLYNVQYNSPSVCVCVGGGRVLCVCGWVDGRMWSQNVQPSLIDHTPYIPVFASFCVSGLVCQHAVFAHTMGDSHA